jgi:toxin ParE1/3/4
VTPQRAELVREAEAELLEAAEFYEGQRPGLARRFLEATERVIGHAADRPLLGSPLGGGIRRYLVPGFPYAVIYRADRDPIRVLAIAHLRRHPDYWRGRR